MTQPDAREPFDLLLDADNDDNEADAAAPMRRRDRREPSAWKGVKAEMLLRWFEDPHIAIAAGMLVVAVQDLKRPKRPYDAHDAKRFLRSQWFNLIADALELDSDHLQCLINKAVQTNSSDANRPH